MRSLGIRVSERRTFNIERPMSNGKVVNSMLDVECSMLDVRSEYFARALLADWPGTANATAWVRGYRTYGIYETYVTGKRWFNRK